MVRVGDIGSYLFMLLMQTIPTLLICLRFIYVIVILPLHMPTLLILYYFSSRLFYESLKIENYARVTYERVTNMTFCLSFFGLDFESQSVNLINYNYYNMIFYPIRLINVYYEFHSNLSVIDMKLKH